MRKKKTDIKVSRTNATSANPAKPSKPKHRGKRLLIVCGVVVQAKAGFGGGEDSGDFGVATEVIAYLDAPRGWYFHVQPLRVVMSGDDYRAGLAVLSDCRALQPV